MRILYLVLALAIGRYLQTRDTAALRRVRDLAVVPVAAGAPHRRPLRRLAGPERRAADAVSGHRPVHPPAHPRLAEPGAAVDGGGRLRHLRRRRGRRRDRHAGRAADRPVDGGARDPQLVPAAVLRVVHRHPRRPTCTGSRRPWPPRSSAAALFAGLYGIYQFVSPPLWDINWMQRSGMTTIGSPEPFAVRVFGPMHSPGILSAFLVMALVIWLARPRMAGLPAAGVAGVALLLSQVRSSWMAMVVAALFVFGSLNAAQRLRMALLTLGAVGLSSMALFTPEMRELVNSRVATMERLEDDESAVARVIGHELALEFVAENPLGAGIGQTDPKMEQYISMRDSVLAASLVQFGLAGTLLYFAALCGLLVLLLVYYWTAASIQGAALASAGLGLLASSIFSVVTAGPIGVCLWMIAGLALGDRAMRLREEELAARRPWPPYHPPPFEAPWPAPA